MCLLPDRPTTTSLLGYHSSFWSDAFVCFIAALFFLQLPPYYASLPMSALKPRLMARNRLPLYTLPSPTDPHYHQPLRVSPGLPLGRPQSFWIASPSLELLPNNRIHKLGLIFNSTVEASDLKILIQMNYVIWNFRNLIFKK